MVGQEGILKVFVSFPCGDQGDREEKLLKRLFSSLENANMDYFISTGKSQESAIKELHTSDIAIFLFSPHELYVSQCDFVEECKADCEMKIGKAAVPYNWCEFKYVLAENIPHIVYIIDEGWDAVGKDSLLQKMRSECKREHYPEIRNNEEDAEIIINDLASKIVDWYCNGKINFNRFCGRRKLLKGLFDKMHKSVEVYGVGGIGKTTLCEVVLLIYQLLGRKIIYVGGEEGYASGTGYEYWPYSVTCHRFSDLTIDDILEVLNFKEELKKAEKAKIDAIVRYLEREDAVLYIDNFKENESLKELVKRGNDLDKGCILVSLKKELGIAFYRKSVESIEEQERSTLVEMMASRMGKRIENTETRRIADIGGGHPVATFLFVSNLGRGVIEELETFTKALDFSRDDDVKEYMDRVIRSSISHDAYIFLKDLAAIEEEIDVQNIHKAFSTVYSFSRKVIAELLDAFILKLKGTAYVWQYHQIREAVFKDNPRRYALAAEYYKAKLEKHGRIEDEIEMLYHTTKIKYTDDILERFLELSDTIREEDPAFRLLPRLGEEIRTHVSGEDGARASKALGKIYVRISKYKDSAENSKKVFRAVKEALKIYTLEDFPVDYAEVQTEIGTMYCIFAEIDNLTENCKKAIEAYKEALKVFTLKDFQEKYAITQTNLGNAYRILSRNENTVKNCKKAVKTLEEALTIHTYDEFPDDYAKAHHNLGNVYITLAMAENTAENSKKAIKSFRETLKIINVRDFPIDYAVSKNNLGIAYAMLAQAEDTAENCKNGIKAFEESLRVYNFRFFPVLYAKTQNNIGNTYNILATIEDAVQNCRKAIKAFKEALKVYSAENFPIKYAMVQYNLGEAYTILAEVENAAENCRKAIKACKESLKVRTFEHFPVHHADTQCNLGRAYTVLARVENTTENCRKAIKAFEESLKVFSSANITVFCARTQNDLGKAYITLAGVEDTAEYSKKAIKAFEESLKIHTLENFPIWYGLIQNDLGKAYITLTMVEDTAENSKKAIKAFKEALKVFTKEKYFEKYQEIKENLFIALQ